MTCSATNSFLRLTHVTWGGPLRSAVGAHFYDSWSVEAPRYADTCFHDHHYSCIDATGRPSSTASSGRPSSSFLEFLLHKLP